jgi:hypothetical protein
MQCIEPGCVFAVPVLGSHTPPAPSPKGGPCSCSSSSSCSRQ